MEFPYQRINVIGSTGCGKSTLAERLARQFDLEFIELDALYWLPNWEHHTDEEFQRIVEDATKGPRWAVAGNYSRARQITWPRTEAVIWLDYTFGTIFWRLWRRTWRRWWKKEVLWGTNYERLWPQFKIWSPEDSLFRWLFQTYWRRKREYPQLFALPEYSHLKVFHMHSPQETEEWLKRISNTDSA